MSTAYRNRFAALLATLAALSCIDRDPTSARGPSLPPPSLGISDALHGGNARFRWLPPLVPPTSASVTAPADPTVLPTVVICDIGAEMPQASTPCLPDRPLIASFSVTAGTGGEVIRYDASSESYIVNWHTDKSVGGALDPTHFYRITVRVGHAELGYADVDPVSTGRDLKNTETGGYISLVNGRTLPIKFRIEVGAVMLTPADGSPTSIGTNGGAIVSEEGGVAFVIPATALEAPTPITVAVAPPPDDAGGLASSVYTFGPSGTTFTVPAVLTIGFDPAVLGGVLPQSVRLYRRQTSAEPWALVPGSGANSLDNTVSGLVDHFTEFVAGSVVADVVITPIDLVVHAGEQATLAATLYDAGGTDLPDRVVTWQTLDPGLAIIDQVGVLTGIAAGTARIVAESEGAADTVEVTVVGVVDPKIAFVGERAGVWEIYTTGADGSGMRRVTQGGRYDWPVWSPDGSKLAYMAMRTGGPVLVVANADGSDPQTVSPGPIQGGQPRWSPDGGQLLVTAPLPENPSRAELFVVQVDGSGWRRLTNTSSAYGWASNGSWSPDGRRIAFERGGQFSDVFVIAADGTGEQRVTTGCYGCEEQQGANPVWSPDGGLIAYRSGFSNLWTVRPDGSDRRQLTTDYPLATNEVTPFAWSPDGTRLVYVNRQVGRGDLMLVNRDGSGKVGLMSTSVAENGPIWSADGERVLFTRFPGGSVSDLVSRSVTGSDEIVIASGGQNFHVDWRGPFPRPLPPDDAEAPVLAILTEAPITVYTQDGPAIVDFQIRATDASGVASLDGTLSSIGSCTVAAGSLERTAGDEYDGEWRCRFVIPQSSSYTSMALSIRATDRKGIQGAQSVDPAVYRNDNQGPILSEVAATPLQVYTHEGPASVTVSFRAVDPAGVRSVSASLGNVASCSTANDETRLISGTIQDGRWECVVTVPQGSAYQTGMVSVGAVDRTGYGGSAGSNLEFVRNDNQGPALSDIAVDPLQAYTHDAAVPVTVSFRAVDPGGIQNVSASLGSIASCTTSSGETRLVSGTIQDGRWECVVTVPQGSAYQTGMVSVGAVDRTGYGGNASSALQFVRNDNQGPVLSDIAATPLQAYTHDGPAAVTVAFRAVDPGGVRSVSASLGNVGSCNTANNETRLVSGTIQDGRWECVVTVPQGSAYQTGMVSVGAVDRTGYGGSAGSNLEFVRNDNQGPTITSITASRSSANTYYGSVAVTITFRAVDPGGVQRASAALADGSCSATLQAGTMFDGTWACTVTVRQYTSGTYIVNAGAVDRTGYGGSAGGPAVEFTSNQ